MTILHPKDFDVMETALQELMQAIDTPLSANIELSQNMSVEQSFKAPASSILAQIESLTQNTSNDTFHVTQEEADCLRYALQLMIRTNNELLAYPFTPSKYKKRIQRENRAASVCLSRLFSS